MFLLGFFGNLTELVNFNFDDLSDKNKDNPVNKIIKKTNNASWMLNISPKQIISVNELKPGLQILEYKLNKLFKVVKNIDTKGLDLPVYMIKYKYLIYVSFYGSLEDNIGKNSGIGIYNLKKNNLSVFPLNDGKKHQFHCIDIFKIQNTNKNILITLDVIGSKLYQFINDNFIELFDFKPINGILQNPRHLIQIPNSNRIIVLTEKYYPRLYLLEYRNGKFVNIYSSEIKLPVLKPNHLTGAEIRIDPDQPDLFYISLRLYDKEFDEYDVPKSIRGLLVRYQYIPDEIDKFQVNRYWKVGFTPRYFTFNMNLIYVTNQGKGEELNNSSLTVINKNTDKIVDKIKTSNGCCFILPLDK